eukprot:7631294-Pyramimonas_sp.AAC.1
MWSAAAPSPELTTAVSVASEAETTGESTTHGAASGAAGATGISRLLLSSGELHISGRALAADRQPAAYVGRGSR